MYFHIFCRNTFNKLKMLYATSDQGLYNGVFLFGRHPKQFPLRKVTSQKITSNWQVMIMRKYEPWEEELKLLFERLFESGIPGIMGQMKDLESLDSNPNARGNVIHVH